MRRRSRAPVADVGVHARWIAAALLVACGHGCAANQPPGASQQSTRSVPGASNGGKAGNGSDDGTASDFGNAPGAGDVGQSSDAMHAASGVAGAVATKPSGRLDAAAILRGSCASSTVQSDLLPSNLLFVLDRSGSMVCNPPPTTDSPTCEAMPTRKSATEPSKWEITTGALTQAITALPANASVGLNYFSNNDGCGVSSAPSVPLAANTPAQRAAIANSLASVEPGGGTPLVGATILAYKYLHESALAGRITGNQFVVLITDGAQSEVCANPPTCTDAATCTDLLVEQEVPKAAGAGAEIRTFVIGVPGSEPARTALSSIAKNGGTAPDGCEVAKGNCHFDMTMVADLGQALSTALTQIAGQTLSCELDLPVPTSGALDLHLVNVVYSPASGAEPQLLYQDTHAACDAGANGWQYTADNTKIRLCGPTCDSVRADSGARVDVVLGCPVQAPE